MTDELIESAPAPRLLKGLIQRPPELGRIRMGEKSEKGFPIKLKTFRLTSQSRATLDAAAAIYGGTVREWKDAPDEGMFELVTAASELDVLIPASLAVIDQSYELWQGGTAERRCDGEIESISGQACLCAAEGLTGADKPCDVVTRLKVMLPRVPGLGVWRLDTSGYMAATTLPSTVQLLTRLTPGAWVEATLRAEQRSKRERDEKTKKIITHRFVVPVLDLPGTTIGQIVGKRHETPLLEEGDEPQKPPTAAEKAAARRAEIEAQQATSEPDTSPESAQNAPEGGSCDVASPRGAPCLVAGPHTEHRNGRVSWPTPPEGKAEHAPVSDDEARQKGMASGVSGSAPEADLTKQAAQIFEGDFVEEATFRDAPDPDVQAGLDLLPADHQKKGAR